ncbi:MAG: GTP cyclohydrolase I FolE [Candidatus Latescibacterota bacterium]|nr:GTP cyclohydrolase I FolE [Candidatus Latescibacterota bacterium]
MDYDKGRKEKPEWLAGDGGRRADEIAHHFSEIMRVLGLDLDDPHLQGTPARVGRMYLEIFRGLVDQAEPEITCFPNDEKYSNMVVVRNIEFFSVCSHHMIPFFGCAHIAYIPSEKIIGLSKIARIVEFYARRPQLQERLTEQVVDFIDEKLHPTGAMAVLEARHLCMEMRGVEKTGAETTTSALRGCFEEPRVRDEFFELIRK